MDINQIVAEHNDTFHVTTAKKNIANGVAGLGLQKGISGGIMSGFNLLNAADANLFQEFLGGSGSGTFDMANGKVTLSCPANTDVSIYADVGQAVLEPVYRHVTFRISGITLTGVATEAGFGFGNTQILTPGISNFVGVWTQPGQGGRFITSNGAAYTSTVLPTPAVGDIYTIYASSSQCLLYVNGVYKAIHSTHLSAAPLGLVFGIANGVGQGAGNQMAFDMMLI